MVKGNKFKQGAQKDKWRGNAPAGLGAGQASTMCGTVLPREDTGQAAGPSGRGIPASGISGQQASRGLPRAQAKHVEAHQPLLGKKKSKDKFKTAWGADNVSLDGNSSAQIKHGGALVGKERHGGPSDGVAGVRQHAMAKSQPGTPGSPSGAGATQNPKVGKKRKGGSESGLVPGVESGLTELKDTPRPKAGPGNNCLGPGGGAQSHGDGEHLPRKKSRKNKFKQTGFEPGMQPPPKERGNTNKLQHINGPERRKGALPQSNASQPRPSERAIPLEESREPAEQRGMGKHSRKMTAINADDGATTHETKPSKRQRMDQSAAGRGPGGLGKSGFEAGSGGGEGKGSRATGGAPATLFVTKTDMPSAGARRPRSSESYFRFCSLYAIALCTP